MGRRASHRGSTSAMPDRFKRKPGERTVRVSCHGLWFGSVLGPVTAVGTVECHRTANKLSGHLNTCRAGWRHAEMWELVT